jgi:hypothetical protein
MTALPLATAAAEPDDDLESVTWSDSSGWAHVVRRGSVELVRARAGDLPRGEAIGPRRAAAEQ